MIQGEALYACILSSSNSGTGKQYPNSNKHKKNV
jgi:hypothetical protein